VSSKCVSLGYEQVDREGERVGYCFPLCLMFITANESLKKLKLQGYNTLGRGP